MPTRNISTLGPSGNVKPIPIHHAIPPVGNAIMKITIDTSSGEQDITDLIMQGTFNVGVTSTIGDFDISFLDPDKTYYNLISLFDDVYLYADYGTEATTKRFRFKLESKGNFDFKTNIVGRGIGMILSNKSIIYETLDDDGNQTYKNKSTVIQEIIEDNFSDITDFSEIESDTTQIQKSYFEIPFFDIIEELCGNDKYFYLDKDLVPHYFTKGSVINTNEAIVDGNLVTINDNSNNAEEIYTRVRVYGQSEDGIPVLYTHNIGTTNTGGINKDYIINDTSIKTSTQAQIRAEAEADRLTNPVSIGSLVSILLPSFIPGESLFVSLPEQNINPGNYNIKEFTINLDNEGGSNGSEYPYTTEFTVEQKRTNTPKVIKDIVQSQSELSENNNPNDLDFARIITFETDIGTHDDTQISENYLKVYSGKSQGTWISPIYTLDDDVSEIEIRWAGDNLTQDYLTTSAQLWFSFNGGATWKLNPESGSTSTVVSGRDLRLKVVFNSSDQRVKRLGAYFSY